MEDIKNQIKDKEFYEKIYCEFFGISKFDTEGTTQNESVIRFAQFVSIVDWAEKINKKIKWEFPQTWIPVEEKLPERISNEVYSEKVLVKSIDIETGEELQVSLDWYNFEENMFKEEITFQGLMKVTHWRPIELK